MNQLKSKLDTPLKIRHMIIKINNYLYTYENKLFNKEINLSFNFKIYLMRLITRKKNTSVNFRSYSGSLIL